MAAANDGGVVLALDYPGPYTRNQMKGLDLEAHGFTVRYLLHERLPRATTAAQYAAELYRDCGVAELDVRMVIAYCTAGEMGRALVPLCARGSGRTPGLIVVNPERPTPDSVIRTIEHALRRPLPRPDGAAADDLSDLTLPLFEGLEQELVQVFFEKFDRTGESVARDLSRMQIDWAVHLTAAGNRAAKPSPHELHLSAEGHLCPDGCPSRHITVPGKLEEVFGTAEALAAVLAESTSRHL